jgi:hypothetical protein
LEKFNLPYPESIFELSYFKKNPLPFYLVSKVKKIREFNENKIIKNNNRYNKNILYFFFFLRKILLIIFLL